MDRRLVVSHWLAVALVGGEVRSLDGVEVVEVVVVAEVVHILEGWRILGEDRRGYVCILVTGFSCSLLLFLLVGNRRYVPRWRLLFGILFPPSMCPCLVALGVLGGSGP